MIRVNYEEQTISCSGCGVTVEVMRKTFRDQEALLNRREEMEEEHRACVEFAHDPERAKRERAWNKGIARELGPKRRAA